MNFFKYFYFLLTLGFSFGATAGNFVAIDIDQLDYKRPEANGGDGGDLVFPRVRMSWNDMKLSLKNNSSLLEASIKVKPTYIKFTTPSVTMSFPLEEGSSFFTVGDAKLRNSKVLLNQDYLNFNGSDFSISDGSSRLSLNKFNAYCNGPEGVDMTSVEGLIHGCLHELILNGQEEGDLAGAEIEFIGKNLEDESFHLTSKFKGVKLLNSEFNIEAENSKVVIGGFEVITGKVDFRCQKDKELFRLEPAKLMDNCFNDSTLVVPQIQIKNLETLTGFDIQLDNVLTTEHGFSVRSESVKMMDEEKESVFESITIDCQRNENDKFYNLHVVIAGCVEAGQFSIKRLMNKEVDSTKEKSMISNITGSIQNGKIRATALFKFGITTKVTIDGDIEHDSENKTISVDIRKFKALKIIKSRWILRKIIKFIVGDMEQVKLQGNKLTLQL